MKYNEAIEKALNLRSFYMFRNFQPEGTKIITISELKPHVIRDENGTPIEWIPQSDTVSITNNTLSVMPNLLPGECLKVRLFIEVAETDFETSTVKL